ncbi:MAG: response regulator [Cyanobacteria bacterium P01_C01_bin.120]
MIIDPQKMLLVDDDPYDVELIQLAIQELSFIRTMDVVTDGAQAVEYLLGSREETSVAALPRFVLMDLKLPKLNGIEVLRAIRQDARTQFLPVVIMTSSSEETDLNDCYNLGVNSYVIKPLDFQRFQEFARQVGNYWMTINLPLSVLAS